MIRLVMALTASEEGIDGYPEDYRKREKDDASGISQVGDGRDGTKNLLEYC